MTPSRKARRPPGMTSRFNTRDFRGVGVVLAYWHRWLSARVCAHVVVVNNLLAVYAGIGSRVKWLPRETTRKPNYLYARIHKIPNIIRLVTRVHSGNRSPWRLYSLFHTVWLSKLGLRSFVYILKAIHWVPGEKKVKYVNWATNSYLPSRSHFPPKKRYPF